MPVLPIALFLKVGLDGIGVDVYEEHFWELRPVRFEFLYVGLPALDALQYVNGDNWLGVALAALMRISPETAAQLGADALARLKAAPLQEQQRFLLGECVQAYLPLDETQQREFDRILSGTPYRGVQAMNTTWYQKGKQEGVLQVLQDILEDSFGPLPETAIRRLQSMTPEELGDLRKKVRKADSLHDLGLGVDDNGSS
jgi:hypothetical protein